MEPDEPSGWISAETAMMVLGLDGKEAVFLRNAETLSDKDGDLVCVSRRSVWQYIAYASFDEDGRPHWPD